MGQVLSDGTVIPGMFQVGAMPTGPDENAIYDLFSDLGAHVGVVVAVYPPDDEKNTSNKKVWQYDVMCAVSGGLKMSIPQLYPRCVVASMFGGVADIDRWKPRVETREANQNSKNDGKLSNNSYVIVLCPNGDSRSGYIIGAIPHPNAKTDPSGNEIGDVYHVREYNGLRWTINGKGELVIERKGPTKVDGKPTNTDNKAGDGDKTAGAKLTFDKTGAIQVQTGDGKQSIKLDLQNGDITIVADSRIRIEVGDNGIIETVTGNGGKVTLGGNEHLIKGDTYRKAEDQFFQSMNDFIQTMMTGLGTVAGSFTMEAGAGASIGALVGQLGRFLSALPQFKAQASQYLSEKNTTE